MPTVSSSSFYSQTPLQAITPQPLLLSRNIGWPLLTGVVWTAARREANSRAHLTQRGASTAGVRHDGSQLTPNLNLSNTDIELGKD